MLISWCSISCFPGNQRPQSSTGDLTCMYEVMLCQFYSYLSFTFLIHLSYVASDMLSVSLSTVSFAFNRQFRFQLSVSLSTVSFALNCRFQFQLLVSISAVTFTFSCHFHFQLSLSLSTTCVGRGMFCELGDEISVSNHIILVLYSHERMISIL